MDDAVFHRKGAKGAKGLRGGFFVFLLSSLCALRAFAVKNRLPHLLIGILALSTLAGCLAPGAITPPSLSAATVTSAQLAVLSPCTGGFVAHDLDHITRAPGEIVRLFDSNGAGVAVNDLDGDGDMDLVLADLAGPVSVFWNEGALRFRKESIGLVRRARAVNTVDVDGDGRLDMVLTTGRSAPIWLRNVDGANGVDFQFAPLPGVAAPTYAMNWADLNGDGRLDLVTGSYDAGMNVEMGSNTLFADNAGVYVYLRQTDALAFGGQRLADQAQTLAVGLTDLNRDGRPDILVGNDFDELDGYWLNQGVADRPDWQAAMPFDTISHSTMSFDWGDVDNSGHPALFTTDMKPVRQDVETLAEWLPMIQESYTERPPLDPQRMENSLQVPGQSGKFQNLAYSRGLDATGWSWSGKLGDLDRDGFLDIYVVNGMIAADLLDYLPTHELVEANQVLHNDGAGNFAPAPAWGLGSTRSGRGMSMADLDGDGDLDIVVNNLTSPAQIFENQLCDEGDPRESLLVDLRQPGTENPFAIGAVVVLHTSLGDLRRDVRVASGYLSGDPTRLHFGFPKGTTLDRLEIQWPDGTTSSVDDIEGQTVLFIRKGNE